MKLVSICTNLKKGIAKKSNNLTKIKNRSTHARSKATTQPNNKSTETIGQSTVTPALPDTVNSPFNSLSVPSLADIRQKANLQ